MPVGGQSIVGVGHRGQGRNVAIVVIQRVVVGGNGIGTRGQGRNVAIVVIQRVVVDGIGIGLTGVVGSVIEREGSRRRCK